MKVGILAKNFTWAGGMDFIRNLANGLLSVAKERNITVFILLPVDNKIDSIPALAYILGASVYGSYTRKRPYLPLPKNAYINSARDFIDNTYSGELTIETYNSSDAGLYRCVKRLGIDVILPVNGVINKDIGIPWIGYAYDFQHRYYYNNFSPSECYARDMDYASRLGFSKTILVNSLAVKNDIARFYPWHDMNRVINLPFAPIALPEWLDDRPDILLSYNLPERYFLISNQLWLHKDHPTAIRALYKIADSAPDVHLLMTGEAKEYRRDDYVNELQELIKTYGLNDRVQFLGLLPKRDQIEIMKNSLAVIQPTLFEGGPGGGASYDAIALGVPLILSNINVNKEVTGDNVFFYDAGKPDALADEMTHIIGSPINRASKQILNHNSANNQRLLGGRILEGITLAFNCKDS